jgi:hypothetical protein
MDECTFSLNTTIHVPDVAAAYLYRTARNTILVKAALEMLGRVKIKEKITIRYATS